MNHEWMESTSKIESRIKQDLREFLESRQAESIQIEVEDDTFITIYCFEMAQPPIHLPTGYAVCGGAARNTLLQELGEKVKPPRDIDIVGIEDWIPDRSLMNRLARIFMPDDLKHGHTVSMSSFEGYFRNRDFTINEVLVTGKKIYVTEQGLLDLQDKIVRPTRFELNRDLEENEEIFLENEWAPVRPKLAIKALRLMFEFRQMYGKSQLKELGEWEWQFDKIPTFWLAYGINRAYQAGERVLVDFYLELLKRGVATQTTGSPGATIKGDIDRFVWSLHQRAGDSDSLGFIFTNDHWNYPPADLDEDDSDEYYLQLAQDYADKIKGFKGRERYQV